MKRSDLRRAAWIVTAALLVTALSGCTAQSSSDDSTVDAAPSWRLAGVLSQRLCVSNGTGLPVQLSWSYTDTVEALADNVLAPGATNCATGSDRGRYGLTVRVKWTDRLSQLFTVFNQTLSPPQVVVDSDKQTAMDVTRCAQVFGYFGVNYCTESYNVGQSQRYRAYDWHESVVTRIDDSQNFKEFTLSLEK